MSVSSSSTSPGSSRTGLPPTEDGTDLDQGFTQRLRAAIMAGPGGSPLDSLAGVGLFGQAIVSSEQITQALEAVGHIDRRRRDLPGDVTVAAVLNLALYSGEGYDAVLAATMRQIGSAAPGKGVPTGSALSQARARLTAEPLRRLLVATAGQAGGCRAEPGDGHADGHDQSDQGRLFGLEVTAFDGTTIDLSRQGAVCQEFDVPSQGRYPKARVVTLTRCRTRAIAAAAIGSYATGEQHLCDELADALGPDQVNLADRNFFSMARWSRFSATGAHLIWRVKNGKRSLPAKILKRLGDGSYLVRLRESNGMLYQRRKQDGDRTLPRLPEAIARLIEFDLITTDASGAAKTSRLRLLTTLLDPQAAPAIEIATAYAERWQAELAYYQLKCTLRGNGVVLRGQTPELARQEIWALLIVYNALCDLAARVAALHGIDPDEVSFVAVLRHTRTHLAADVCCRTCGHRPAAGQAMNALLGDITAHPRNRIGRNRVGPRTTLQRRTQRGTTAEYTIEITTSNLPKTA